MAYCTQSDIEKQIPTLELAELTAESGSTPDAAAVTEAIAKADAEIDSYLALKYSVPISPVPARLRSLSEDIAIYYLYSRRSTIADLRKDNYRNAIDFLKSIVAGTVALLNDDGTELGAPQSSSNEVQFESADSIFDQTNMTGF
jgi:phage gp36-like protein